MKQINFLALVIALAIASPATAQPYYGEAPPVTVYAPPPPPIVIRQAIGGLVAGAIELPFAVLGAIFAPPGPVIIDGQGGWVSATNSRYDPVTEQFLPPVAYQAPEPAPATYTPPEPRYEPPATYALPAAPRLPATHRSSAERHSGSSGCYSSDGTLLSTRGDCETHPQPIPDTTQMHEPD
jgi:hypothetical protein